VSHALNHKSLPDTRYQVLQVQFQPLIPLKTSSATFILLPQHSYLNYSHEFRPCYALCHMTFPFIMMLGKYLYYNKKNYDGDSKYGLELIQGSVPISDSYYLKLHHMHFPRMLILSNCCSLLFDTIFSKEKPIQHECVDDKTFWKLAKLYLEQCISQSNQFYFVNYFSQGSILEKCEVLCFFSLAFKCFVIGAT